jgi:ribonuclease P protein subunit RPR2
MASIAEDRVILLLDKAAERVEEDVGTALRIAEAHNISIPERYRIRICRNCESFLHPGKNAEVRVSSGNVKYRCENCGKVNRHGY